MKESKRGGWNSEAKTTPNIDHIFTDEDINNRAFKIEEVDYAGHPVKFVSVESKFANYVHEFKDQKAMNAFLPTDWKDQIAGAMKNTSMVFVPYFPPELDETVYNTRLFGRRSSSFGEQMIDGVYSTIAELAAEQKKQVAVVDIANKASYMFYEVGIPNIFPLFVNASAYGVKPTISEKYFPQAVDARRMFTAMGMKKTIDDAPEGSGFMYIAAPAHVNRVKRYLTEDWTRADRARAEWYRQTMWNMDTQTRIYEHSDAGWTRVSNEPYSKEGIIGPLATAAVIAAGVDLAARKWQTHKNRKRNITV